MVRLWLQRTNTLVVGAVAIFMLNWIRLWSKLIALELIGQDAYHNNSSIPIISENDLFSPPYTLPVTNIHENDETTQRFSGNRESEHATVMGMATGYDARSDFRPFVESLRKSGFSGAIILGIDENVPKRVLKYLNKKNVTIKPIKYTNCTFPPIYQTQEEIQAETNKKTLKQLKTCGTAYPDVKLRWLKYPLGRDWLQDCPQCTGPVLFSDVRDVFFQNDPFGPDSPQVEGLQVFEEHPNMTTSHWLVNWPVKDCKGVHLDNKPMLCSGSTIGTREAMIQYLDTMYQEMKQWLEDPSCRFKIRGGDQAIHNYLFYSGQLGNDVKAIRNREGTVHTVGYEVDEIRTHHLERLYKELNLTKKQASKILLPGANNQTWISKEQYGITNDLGFFTNYDGSRSRVVHQWDRARKTIDDWMEQQGFF